MSLLQRDGIWFASAPPLVPSYPKDGNRSYFQIEDSSFWFQFRNRIISNALQKYSTAGKGEQSFLDVGGGNGFVSQLIQSMGYKTTLLEPGDGVYNAKIRGLKNIYCCSLSDLPAEQKYDNVGLFDVIEHVADPINTLHQVAQHMHNGSKLYLTMPCYKFLWSAEDEHAGHYRRYTLREIQRELTIAGFEIEFSTYFFVCLILPILLLRVAPDFLRRRLGLTEKPRHGATNDHKLRGLTSFVLNSLLSLEFLAHKKLGRLPLGSSLLVIARKESVSRDHES